MILFLEGLWSVILILCTAVLAIAITAIMILVPLMFLEILPVPIIIPTISTTSIAITIPALLLLLSGIMGAIRFAIASYFDVCKEWKKVVYLIKNRKKFL
jgi:hypothetical protein